jgi:hypothetical protein
MISKQFFYIEYVESKKFQEFSENPGNTFCVKIKGETAYSRTPEYKEYREYGSTLFPPWVQGYSFKTGIAPF